MKTPKNLIIKIVAIVIVVILIIFAIKGVVSQKEQGSGNGNRNTNSDLIEPGSDNEIAGIQKEFKIVTTNDEQEAVSPTVLPSSLYGGGRETNYAINTNVFVKSIKDLDADTFAQNFEQEAGSYLLERSTGTLDEATGILLILGYAGGTKNYNYVFNRGDDVVIVSIFVPEGTTPESFVQSFTLNQE